MHTAHYTDLITMPRGDIFEDFILQYGLRVENVGRCPILRHREVQNFYKLTSMSHLPGD